jgi:hypothetical protein
MLHLGRNLMISEKNIIAIFGLQGVRPPAWTRPFTHVRAGDPPYKSMILVDDGKLSRLIFSPVSPSTLHGRIDMRRSVLTGRKDSKRPY